MVSTTAKFDPNRRQRLRAVRVIEPAALDTRHVAPAHAIRIELRPSRPAFPKQPRWKLRVLIGVFAVMLLAVGVTIACPVVLDPLCDDYDWFGAGAATAVRDAAWTANEAVFR